jgi:PAS domain S-box-containing protein
MYGTNQDITERMTTEAERERLLAEVQRLAAIVENHPDFIGIGSLEGEALYINPAGLTMVGLPLDQDVSQIDFIQFNPPEEVEQFIKEAIPTAFEAGSWTAEGTLLRVDRTSLAVEKTVAVNYGADKKPISLSITMRDVTERKSAEAERERLLAEVEAAYRQYVRQEWDQFLGEQHQGRWRIEHQQAELPETLSDNGKTGAALEVPVSLRGQAIGTLSLEDIAPDRNWTAEEKALVETVAQQLALTVENLRLFEDTQQQATREQLTRQITDKMRSAPDAESIIQVGVQELAKVFQSSHLVVELDMNSNDNEALVVDG